MVPNFFSGRNGLWVALALMLVLALPGFFSLPPVDRDEVLFSQASSQMLASGDMVDIRFADMPRYKKPVGIYWLQSAAAAITLHPADIWSYRLVSLLGAMIAVGFTWAIAMLILPGEFAFLAAMALASCLLLGAEARLAKTDAMLLATIMAAQYVLARAFLPLGRAQMPVLSTRLAMGFWVALAAGTLVKGPIGPMVVAFTLAGLCAVRRDLAVFRALRPLWGAALFLALAAPWFVAITIKSDGAFWAASLGRDMFEKIANARENHGAPPGTYLAVLWLTFWPGSMWLAAVVPFLWRNRAAPALMFAVVWAVPTWVVFELTATKLVHYVLPTYPALALICAWLLWKGGAARSWLASLPALVPALIFGFMWYEAGKLGASLPLWFWAASGLTVLATAGVVWALRRAAPVPLAFSLAAAGFALSGTVYPTLAQMNALWPARTIAAIAQGHPDCRLIVAGFAEPSLVFLTRNKVSFVSADAAKAALAAPDCAVIAMARADAPGMAFDTEVTGLDLGSGKPVDLLVFVRP